MKKLILLTAMLLTMTVGFAKDIKTLVVTTTPPMHCESCENKVLCLHTEIAHWGLRAPSR